MLSNWTSTAPPPPDDQITKPIMDQIKNQVPDANHSAPKDKPAAAKLPAITPSTSMETLEQHSAGSLKNALRSYSKAARKNRSYRHICRLIKAEQKRRCFPVFEAIPPQSSVNGHESRDQQDTTKGGQV